MVLMELISNRLDVVLALKLILQGLLTCNPRIGSYHNYMFSLEILYALIDVEIWIGIVYEGQVKKSSMTYSNTVEYEGLSVIYPN
jgi:hypothetical protein